MVSDRLTKEELKEDRVLAAATQAVEYARKNARWVVAAVAVAVVATVAAIVVIQGRVSSEKQASLLLLKAQGMYAAGDYAGAAGEFGNLVSRYGRTPSGRLGRLYLGNSQLTSGNPTAAEGSFRRFLSGGRLDPLSESGARRGLAGALLAQGKPAEAAAEYAKAARIEGNPLAAEDGLQAALAHSRAGNRSEAIQALQALLEKSPRSQVAMEARVRLKELQAQ